MPIATPNSPSGSSTSRSDRYSQVWLPVASSEANTVPTSRLSWATDDENKVGSISLATRRTSGCENPGLSRGRSPSLPSAGHSTSNCSAPAASTPQARALTGSANFGASHSIAAIMVRLCSTGVAAGSANLPKLFSTEATSAIIEMATRYGNVMRSICAISASFSSPPGVPTAPGANSSASSGAASMPMPATTNTSANSAPAMWSMKSFNAALSPRSRSSLRTGTKAICIEPSAKIRRR